MDYNEIIKNFEERESNLIKKSNGEEIEKVIKETAYRTGVYEAGDHFRAVLTEAHKRDEIKRAKFEELNKHAIKPYVEDGTI